MKNRKANLLKEYDNNVKRYEYMRSLVTNLIEELLREEKINSITSRVKERVSLEGKIDRKGEQYQCINDITDLVGIRIITYYSDDVDRIANIIEREFIVDRANTIDKRKAMKPETFGYLSLHYVVQLNTQRQCLTEYSNVKDIKFEIQIRSILQHTWAEIEHDLGYKSDIGIPAEVRRDFSRLAGLLELADKEFLGIRKNLKAYKDDVIKGVVEQKTEKMLIDYISLQSYVQNSGILKSMNNEIAMEKRRRIVETPQAVYIQVIKELHWLQCNEMDNLDKLIERNKSLALKLALNILDDDEYEYENDYFFDTISLLYICYAELLNSGQDEEGILSFLYDNGFDSIDGTNEDFAKLLLSFKD